MGNGRGGVSLRVLLLQEVCHVSFRSVDWAVSGTHAFDVAGDHACRAGLRRILYGTMRRHRGLAPGSFHNLQEAIDAADDGAAITVEGVCSGPVMIYKRRDLTIRGVTPNSGCPANARNPET